MSKAAKKQPRPAISAVNISYAVEYLMTAQRAMLIGYAPDAREVVEPLQWALLKLGQCDMAEKIPQDCMNAPANSYPV